MNKCVVWEQMRCASTCERCEGDGCDRLISEVEGSNSFDAIRQAADKLEANLVSEPEGREFVFKVLLDKTTNM